MGIERRRVPRVAFGGVVEMSSISPPRYIIAPVADLSRLGCFVRTGVPIPVGTNVSLKIRFDGNEFNAPGEVVHVLDQTGVGITFGVTAPEDQALMETWLMKITGSN
jgi:hypothetical protein